MSMCVAVVFATALAADTARADNDIPEALSGRNIIVNRLPAYATVPINSMAGDAAVIFVPSEGALSDDVRRVIDRFAAEGLIAMAVTTSGEETLDTISQAASTLRELSSLRAGRVGIVGAGESARWAWLAATGGAKVDAMVTYDFVEKSAELGGPRVPHLELEGVAPGEHAAAAEVWRRTMGFLNEHLGLAAQRRPSSAWTAPFGVPGASRERTAEARRVRR